MKKLKALLLLVLVGMIAWMWPVRALDPVQELQQEIDELTHLREMSEQATAPLEEELEGLQTKIKSIRAQLLEADRRVIELEEDIEVRSDELVGSYRVLSLRVRDYYKYSRTSSPLITMLASSNAPALSRQLSYQSALAEDNRVTIVTMTQELLQLEGDKKQVEERKVALASLRGQFEEEAAFFEGEIAGAKNYQEELTQQIAVLSAKQQEILAAKFSSAPVPLLAQTSLGGCSSDEGKSSGFSPRYGFFTLGVPNKTGLNQFGAKGRAESGQNYENILSAYYANYQISDYGTGFNITVNGTNPYGQTFNNQTYNIEDYLKHLYEMPATWHPEALKAQAIAARSYALYITNNGQNTIQPNENNQVVKLEENADSWKSAVDATRGKVMLYGGSPIGAWYSSTHGGFVLTSGEIGWSDKPWTKHAVDAGSASNIGDLKNSAYDKSSPWFYCDWGYRSEYNNTAWLKAGEVEDIVNAYILWEKDHNTITHLSQTDKDLPDVWSADQVRQEILNRGGSPIGNIGSISVSWDGSGISRTIVVNGRSFDAQKFKNMFNLRAPANIQIKPTCQPDASLNCSKMYALFDVVVEN